MDALAAAQRAVGRLGGRAGNLSVGRAGPVGRARSGGLSVGVGRAVGREGGRAAARAAGRAAGRLPGRPLFVLLAAILVASAPALPCGHGLDCLGGSASEVLLWIPIAGGGPEVPTGSDLHILAAPRDAAD